MALSNSMILYGFHQKIWTEIERRERQKGAETLGRRQHGNLAGCPSLPLLPQPHTRTRFVTKNATSPHSLLNELSLDSNQRRAPHSASNSSVSNQAMWARKASQVLLCSGKGDPPLDPGRLPGLWTEHNLTILTISLKSLTNAFRVAIGHQVPKVWHPLGYLAQLPHLPAKGYASTFSMSDSSYKSWQSSSRALAVARLQAVVKWSVHQTAGQHTWNRL